jgi:hypothetical protein
VSVFEDLKKTVGDWYRRAENQPWNNFEEQSLFEVSQRPEVKNEVLLIRKLRAGMNFEDRKRFFPQSVASCLSKWDELLDKARVRHGTKPAKPPQANPQAAKPIAGPTLQDLKDSLEYFKNQRDETNAKIYEQRIAEWKA